MTRLKAVIVAAVAVLVLGAGAAWAAASFRTGTTAKTTGTEPAVYGACVNLRTGTLRILERNNLAKSRWGACRQDGSERYISFPSGTTGLAAGSVQPFLTGKGAPAATTGKAGQFYLDTQAGALYGPKTSNGWGAPIPLKGADGKDGEDGAPGKDGADGRDGKDGASAYEVWRDAQPEGADTSLNAFLDAIRGPKGEPGKDAEVNEDVVRDLLYQVWRTAQPADADTSMSAFRDWLARDPQTGGGGTGGGDEPTPTPAVSATPTPTPSPTAS